MTLMTIRTAKKTGTTIGGTNHVAEVPELSRSVLMGRDSLLQTVLEAPPSLSQRAMAAALLARSASGFSGVCVITLIRRRQHAATTRADHEDVRELGCASDSAGAPTRNAPSVPQLDRR
jgi:hypothetical protein